MIFGVRKLSAVIKASTILVVAVSVGWIGAICARADVPVEPEAKVKSVDSYQVIDTAAEAAKAAAAAKSPEPSASPSQRTSPSPTAENSAASTDQKAPPTASSAPGVTTPSARSEPPYIPSKKLLKINTDDTTFNLGASESMIAWEKWHHVVGRAIHKRVQKVTNTSLGRVLLDIMVTKDCKLTAHVVSASSEKMGDLCMNATKSLDGDPVLIFPYESKRDAVRFKFEYKRGFFFLPKNHYITDDFERVGDKQNDDDPH